MPTFQIFTLLLVMLAALQLSDGNARRASSEEPCDSPMGNDCCWYRRCLEEKVHCAEGDGPDYAIAHGEKYCHRYTSYYKNFTEKGQTWVTAYRKCIEEKLAALFEVSTLPSCSMINSTGFLAMVPCSVEPSSSAPSFCDLISADRTVVIKSVLHDVPSEVTQYLINGMKAAKPGCTPE